jgi:hypothetical protein
MEALPDRLARAGPDRFRFPTQVLSDGRVYLFTQVMNPGPSILWGQRYYEAEMKIEVDRAVAGQGQLRRIAALKAPRARARQAAKHLAPGSPYPLDEASAILEGGGTDALPKMRWILRDDAKANVHPSVTKVLANVGGEEAWPVLRGIVRDESKASLHGCAVRALAVAGGEAVVAELTAMVEKELRSWKKTALGLERGRVNGTGLEPERVGFLGDRYNFVVEAFYALQRVKSPVCRYAADRFRDY